jgi:hypothetical protein
MVSAIAIWVVGHETLAHRSAEISVTQLSAHPVTWEKVRNISANALDVPERQVTPGTRLSGDLHAQVNDIGQILTDFEKKLGIVGQPNQA